MKKWLEELRLSPVKKALPVLSFPAVQLLGISVKELISDSDRQAKGMQLIAEQTDSAAAVSLMDLSVEAECFGSRIRVTDKEVPTVVGRIVHDEEEADALEVPKVGSARSGLYVETIEKAVKLITDRPVFAGAIGPFSLAARLLDVAEIMMDCYDEPEMVEKVLEKSAAFIIEYCRAFKEAGANGVVLAEPVTGLLSPALAEAVRTELERQLSLLPREEIARASIEANGKIILTGTVPEAIEIANALAPEHLELCVDNPFDYLDQVKNAGSIFMGRHCPEALGDYFAGPNHTLPTNGAARYASPLSVDDFIKKSQFTYYTGPALSAAAGKIAAFARQEGLEGHARSVQSRFEEETEA